MPEVEETSVERAPHGASVRLKLTLSYAGVVVLTGAAVQAAAWVVVLRDLPDIGALPGGTLLVRSELIRDFTTIAALEMAFLVVFGLLGGWFLAGRMLAP